MLRYVLTLLLSSTLLTVTGVNAQNKFVGGWRGYVPTGQGNILVNTIMTPDGRYSTQMQMAGYMALNTGHYYILDSGLIRFTVEDYEPKQFLGRPILRPPDSLFKYQFTSPDAVVLNDVSLGGTIYYRRSQ